MKTKPYTLSELSANPSLMESLPMIGADLSERLNRSAKYLREVGSVPLANTVRQSIADACEEAAANFQGRPAINIGLDGVARYPNGDLVKVEKSR